MGQQTSKSVSSRPVARGRRRLGLLAGAVALASLLALIAAPGALAGIITPEHGGSPNADSINGLYKVALYIAIVVFIGVEGALLYALLRFRARRGAVPAQIRGNTSLEIGWTVGAAVILVALAVVTFVKLDDIQSPPNSDANASQTSASSGVLYATAARKLPPNGKSLNVCVNGQQYIWRYTYAPDCNNAPLSAPYSYEEMVVPTNTTVTIDGTAQDVIHSWWVPKLGGKIDTVPGYHNYTWFKISKPGIFRGACAELCGRLHARMIATVRAVAPADFDAWLAKRKQDIAAANAAAQASRAKLNSLQGPASVENP